MHYNNFGSKQKLNGQFKEISEENFKCNPSNL